MEALDLELLLAPITAESPCGPDLEYDTEHWTLMQAAEGKAEQQYGDYVSAAVAPDWPAIRAGAVELLGRTKDLRITVLLWRAAARCGTLAERIDGFVKSLLLIAKLLDRHWECVHPQLDAADGDDPTLRLNALAPLGDTFVLPELIALAGLEGDLAGLGENEIADLVADRVAAALAYASPNAERLRAGIGPLHDAVGAIAELFEAWPDHTVERLDRLQRCTSQWVRVIESPGGMVDAVSSDPDRALEVAVPLTAATAAVRAQAEQLLGRLLACLERLEWQESANTADSRAERG